MGILRRFRGYFGAQRIRGNYSASQGYLETNSDPNVKVLYYFDEPSGDLVDEISGVTVIDPNGYPGEDLTYNVAATGLFAGVSPGVKTGVISSNPYFAKLSDTPELNIGANEHVVVEFYGNTASTTSQSFCAIMGAAAPNGSNYGIYITFNSGSPDNMEIVFKADDGSAALITGNLSVDFNDGNIHKFRIVFQRGGNIEVFIDGVSQGTASMGGISSSDTITCHGFNLTGSYTGDATNRWRGTSYTARISIGTDVVTNNLGGPGGG